MRVSVDKRDPGYKSFASIFHVKFNGEEVTGVVTADEERGFIRRYVKNEDGSYKVHGDGKHFVLETVEGLVEVWATNQRGENVRVPKVKVERNRDGAIEVLVYSQIKPGVIRRTLMDEKTLAVKKAPMRSAVNIAAGAAAEHCCARYGDLFDPSAVAMLATEEYDRLARLESTRH